MRVARADTRESSGNGNESQEARLAEEAAGRARAAAESQARGPTCLAYNRNPVVCYYNMPVRPALDPKPNTKQHA